VVIDRALTSQWLGANKHIACIQVEELPVALPDALRVLEFCEGDGNDRLRDRPLKRGVTEQGKEGMHDVMPARLPVLAALGGRAAVLFSYRKTWYLHHLHLQILRTINRCCMPASGSEHSSQ